MNADTLLMSTQALLIILFIVVMALFIKGLIAKPATPDRRHLRRQDGDGASEVPDPRVDDGHSDPS